MLNDANSLATVEGALARGKGFLHDENPREIEWLLGDVLGWTQMQLITQSKHHLTVEQQVRYEALLSRRLQGEPLAYLLGEWEFWSLKLAVGPAVLIPRPESELLVELALASLPPHVFWEVADLGTGSGAIALALASERPFCCITATDCCPNALSMAQANARRLGLTHVEFLMGNWCLPLAQRRFHLILSNPPYVATHDPCLEQLRFEPKLALTAGHDGLSAIRSIVSTAQTYLYPGGMLLLEHGDHQGRSVRQLLAQFNYKKIKTMLDLENRERVTTGEI